MSQTYTKKSDLKSLMTAVALANKKLKALRTHSNISQDENITPRYEIFEKNERKLRHKTAIKAYSTHRKSVATEDPAGKKVFLGNLTLGVLLTSSVGFLGGIKIGLYIYYNHWTSEHKITIIDMIKVLF